MTEQEWRDSLKTGDEVCIARRNGKDEIKTVSKTTATQIIIDYGPHEDRYRKKDGQRVGNDRFYYSSIRPATDEIKNRIEVANLRSGAQRLISSLPIPTSKEELERFIATLRDLGAK